MNNQASKAPAWPTSRRRRRPTTIEGCVLDGTFMVDDGHGAQDCAVELCRSGDLLFLGLERPVPEGDVLVCATMRPHGRVAMRGRATYRDGAVCLELADDAVLVAVLRDAARLSPDLRGPFVSAIVNRRLSLLPLGGRGRHA